MDWVHAQSEAWTLTFTRVSFDGKNSFSVYLNGCEPKKNECP